MTLLELGKREIDKIPGGTVITRLIDIAIDAGKEVSYDNFDLSMEKHAIQVYLVRFTQDFEAKIRFLPIQSRLMR